MVIDVNVQYSSIPVTVGFFLKLSLLTLGDYVGEPFQYSRSYYSGFLHLPSAVLALIFLACAEKSRFV